MKKVLIVDDSQLILKITRSILEKAGYSVLDASDGAECFEVLAKEKPDLILLDVNMPGMDGCDLCTKIKRNETTSDILVVMFTTSSTDWDVRKSFEYGGADAHINKPFEKEELVNLVKNLLKE